MSTSKEQFAEIISYLEPFGDVRGRPMMGEYLLYLNETLIGGVYDNRLLLKSAPENETFNLPEVLPYSSAKHTMFDASDYLCQPILKSIVLATYQGLTKKA